LRVRVTPAPRPEITLHGGNTAPPLTWTDFGWLDYAGGWPLTTVWIPGGKRFKLYALGLESCESLSEWYLRAYDFTRGQAIKTMNKGVFFESYPIPYQAVGACYVRLQGYHEAISDLRGSGYMVFWIA